MASRFFANRALQRHMSTGAKIQRTPEEIKAGLEKVNKLKTFNQHKTTPAALTDVVGNGKDLHIPKNIAEMAALSGMPADQAKRIVVIAQRPLKSLQSGQRLSHQWQITWKHTERWSNPLMGWTSTADPMSNVKLNFDTQEAAVAFAERNGWKFEIKAETSKTNTTPGTYLYKHNFLDKRTTAEVQKLGHKTKIFELPTYGESHWFMPLNYHGDGEVIQHGPPSKK